jgi:hypothetical protein
LKPQQDGCLTQHFWLARLKLNLLYEDIKARDVAKKRRANQNRKEQVILKGFGL